MEMISQLVQDHRKRFPMLVERFERLGPFWVSYSHWGLFEMPRP